MTNHQTPLTFTTKRGFCHVFEDRIVLTNDGNYNKVASNPKQQERNMFVYLYAFMAVYFLFQAVEGYQESKSFALARMMLVLVLAVVVVKSFNTTGIPLILRSDIISVVYSPAKKHMTRPYFTIHYKNNKGAVKRRLIMLPGSLSGGNAATEKAVDAMATMGYI